MVFLGFICSIFIYYKVDVWYWTPKICKYTIQRRTQLLYWNWTSVSYLNCIICCPFTGVCFARFRRCKWIMTFLSAFMSVSHDWDRQHPNIFSKTKLIIYLLQLHFSTDASWRRRLNLTTGLWLARPIPEPMIRTIITVSGDLNRIRGTRRKKTPSEKVCSY